MLERIRGRSKVITNEYVVRKKSFEVEIQKTVLDMDALSTRCSNLDEFFNVIDW